MKFPIFAIGIALTAALASLGEQRTSNARVPAFHADPTWPTIPNNWVLGEVSSVAVDSSDQVWLLQRPGTVPEPQRANAAPPVIVFDAKGKFVRSWGGPSKDYDWPEREHGIYVDPDNNVW